MTQHTACPPGQQKALRSRSKAGSAVWKWTAMFKRNPELVVSAHSWFACYGHYLTLKLFDTETLYLCWTLLASTVDFGLWFGLFTWTLFWFTVLNPACIWPPLCLALPGNLDCAGCSVYLDPGLCLDLDCGLPLNFFKRYSFVDYFTWLK